jgi:hypothetical protein
MESLTIEELNADRLRSDNLGGRPPSLDKRLKKLAPHALEVLESSLGSDDPVERTNAAGQLLVVVGSLRSEA